MNPTDLRKFCEKNNDAGDISTIQRDALWEYVYNNSKGESPQTVSDIYGEAMNLCMKFANIW